MSLSLKGVRKQLADEVHLYHVDAEFSPGLNVLAGPTTAGKTSLLRLIAGLDKTSAGRITLNGEDLTNTPVRKRSVAIVYQQYINYPNFTVYDNIASPLRLAKLSNTEIDKKVRQAAELLAIGSYLQRLPEELSGGQQQRTAIARALVKDADVILLDEPLVNLDYKLREQLRRELRALFADTNKIAIYATTEPLEAALLGDNLVVIDAGRVLQSGSASDLFQAPNSLRVAEILSDPRVNSILLNVHNNTARCEPFFNVNLLRHGDLVDGQYYLALRPHHLHLSDTQTNDDDIVKFRTEVQLAEVAGSETLLHIRVGGAHWIIQQAGVHQYQLGDEVDVYFKVQDLLLFDRDGRRVTTPEPRKATG